MCGFGTAYWYYDIVTAEEAGRVYWYLGPDASLTKTHGLPGNSSALASGTAYPPPAVEVLKQFFRFFLLNYQLIPVSLYVSLNLISMFQQFFMVRDLHMYSSANGGQRCRVSTMELNDELGLVTHLLSDKTGTVEVVHGFVSASGHTSHLL